uniref:Uncharacterized protein n=1 Tax=Caenorhabditis japonica TaxID=281687 RepID=A0A8R1E789_CAEJA
MREADNNENFDLSAAPEKTQTSQSYLKKRKKSLSVQATLLLQQQQIILTQFISRTEPQQRLEIDERQNFHNFMSSVNIIVENCGTEVANPSDSAEDQLTALKRFLLDQ